MELTSTARDAEHTYTLGKSATTVKVLTVTRTLAKFKEYNFFRF